TVGKMLAKKHGYLFVSVTELLRDEAKRRDQPVEREVLRTISAEWRRESRLGVLVDKAVAEYEKLKDKYVGVVMASLRNPGEADRIHELGGVLVWVDADPRVRYERVLANATSRGRVAEDTKTFEQFLAEEEAEMHKPAEGDDANLNMAGVKAKADISIQNDSADLAQFEQDVERALGLG
ncbi:MAG TPA: hypothetical protein VLG13_02010, partial [Patescibacteria group bacterium]|nr:hypothetical protein [Patescibacteria group bacterium]